jgi:hypothetical protein
MHSITAIATALASRCASSNRRGRALPFHLRSCWNGSQLMGSSVDTGEVGGRLVFLVHVDAYGRACVATALLLFFQAASKGFLIGRFLKTASQSSSWVEISASSSVSLNLSARNAHALGNSSGATMITRYMGPASERMPMSIVNDSKGASGCCSIHSLILSSSRIGSSWRNISVFICYCLSSYVCLMLVRVYLLYVRKRCERCHAGKRETIFHIVGTPFVSSLEPA